MTKDRLPLEIDDEDQQELEAISQLRKEDEIEIELDKLRAGKTELDALFFLATRGTLACSLGCGILGAIVATFIYPIIGTVGGFLASIAIGFFTSLIFAIQYVVLRGRISIEFMMLWAGVNSGIVGVMISLPIRPFDRFDPWSQEGMFKLGLCLLAGIACGIATLIVGRRLWSKFLLSEGLGFRKWWRFGILDLLIQTTWIASLVVVIKMTELSLVLERLALMLATSWVIALLLSALAWLCTPNPGLIQRYATSPRRRTRRGSPF